MRPTWRQTSEAKSLLRLAKAMQSLRKPVSDIPNRCAKLVLEMNHAIEKFELSRKDKFSFLTLSQSLDKKLYEISILRSRIDEVGYKGSAIEAEIFSIAVPVFDADGIALKGDVIEASAILADTLDNLRDKLDSVQTQLEEIRDEARSEVNGSP